MNEGFAADWLGLRRVADHRARDNGLAEALSDWLGARSAVRVLDLGAGTGSNPAFLAPRLAAGQHWRLLDHDAELLAAAEASVSDLSRVTAEAVVCDIAAAPVAPVGDSDVVTASALLDLVSRDWLAAVVDAAADVRAALLFVLNYSGQVRWRPALAGDGAVTDAVNAHQRRDKGFGPALGPEAAEAAAALCAERGYRVMTAASDWWLGPDAAALQGSFLAGRLAAACAQVPASARAFDRWARARQCRIDAGASALTVGHRCLLALPGLE